MATGAAGVVTARAAQHFPIINTLCECADGTADLGIAESHEFRPPGAMAGFTAVRRRDVVLYPVADDSVFKRRAVVPKHYIIWLLISLLLAIKAFAFSPISDLLAMRQLLFPLLAAALFAPYLRRSARVKRTFVNP